MTEIKTLEMAKKEAVEYAVKHTKTAVEAAKALGVSRATLYRLMKAFGIHRKADPCQMI